MSTLRRIKKILAGYAIDHDLSDINSQLIRCVLTLAAEFDKHELETEIDRFNSLNINAVGERWGIGVKNRKGGFGMIHEPFLTEAEALDIHGHDGEYILCLTGNSETGIIKRYWHGKLGWTPYVG